MAKTKDINTVEVPTGFVMFGSVAIAILFLMIVFGIINNLTRSGGKSIDPEPPSVTQWHNLLKWCDSEKITYTINKDEYVTGYSDEADMASYCYSVTNLKTLDTEVTDMCVVISDNNYRDGIVIFFDKDGKKIRRIDIEDFLKIRKHEAFQYKMDAKLFGTPTPVPAAKTSPKSK
jgi:hypothetical protein